MALHLMRVVNGWLGTEEGCHMEQGSNGFPCALSSRKPPLLNHNGSTLETLIQSFLKGDN